MAARSGNVGNYNCQLDRSYSAPLVSSALDSPSIRLNQHLGRVPKPGPASRTQAHRWPAEHPTLPGGAEPHGAALPQGLRRDPRVLLGAVRVTKWPGGGKEPHRRHLLGQVLGQASACSLVPPHSPRGLADDPQLGETEQVVPTTWGRCRGPIQPLLAHREAGLTQPRRTQRESVQEKNTSKEATGTSRAGHPWRWLRPLSSRRKALQPKSLASSGSCHDRPALGLLCPHPHSSLGWALLAAPCVQGEVLQAGQAVPTGSRSRRPAQRALGRRHPPCLCRASFWARRSHRAHLHPQPLLPGAPHLWLGPSLRPGNSHLSPRLQSSLSKHKTTTSRSLTRMWQREVNILKLTFPFYDCL